MIQTGQICGSVPGYMSPEQALGQGRRIGPAADVYALGAMLYELLTDQTPVRPSASLVESLWMIIEQPPVPPRQIKPDLPRDLETICLKCLQKDPVRRYASAEALAEDLRAAGPANEPIVARPVGKIERAWLWAHRKPALALAGASSAIALLVILFGGIAFLMQKLDFAEKEKKQEQAAAADFQRTTAAGGPSGPGAGQRLLRGRRHPARPVSFRPRPEVRRRRQRRSRPAGLAAPSAGRLERADAEAQDDLDPAEPGPPRRVQPRRPRHPRPGLRRPDFALLRYGYSTTP